MMCTHYLFNVDDIFINYEYQYLQIIDINIYKCQNIYFIDLYLHFKSVYRKCTENIYRWYACILPILL